MDTNLELTVGTTPGYDDFLVPWEAYSEDFPLKRTGWLGSRPGFPEEATHHLS